MHWLANITSPILGRDQLAIEVDVYGDVLAIDITNLSLDLLKIAGRGVFDIQGFDFRRGL